MDHGAPAGKNTNLKKYCDKALEFGLTHAVVIDPASVVTAAWVRFKCQFGCSHYGETYSCPPHSPTHRETAEMLATYTRAILFHAEVPYSNKWEMVAKKIKLGLLELEGEIFKDGYYRALALLGGTVHVLQGMRKPKRRAVYLSGEAPAGNGVMRDRCISNRQE